MRVRITVSDILPFWTLFAAALIGVAHGSSLRAQPAALTDQGDGAAVSDAQPASRASSRPVFSSEADHQPPYARLAITIGNLEQRYRAYRRIGEGYAGIELAGLVVDETVSKLGRDFYAAFYQIWEAPPGASNFTLTIGEKPLPNRGTLVTVRVDDDVMFNGRLQPNQEIEPKALYAARLAYRHLKQRRGSQEARTF